MNHLGSLLYINVELGFEHWSVADWTIIPIVSLLWMLQLDVCEAICRTGAGFQWFSMVCYGTSQVLLLLLLLDCCRYKDELL